MLVTIRTIVFLNIISYLWFGFIFLNDLPEFGLMLLTYDEKDDKLVGLCLRNQTNGIYMEQSDKDLGRLPWWERPRIKAK